MQGEERCIIALGSNTDALRHLSEARALMRNHFPDIRFSTPLQTQPIGLSNPCLFINQTATFHTALPLTETSHLLKEIETVCANPPKDKSKELIYIDIDLLQYGNTILKPEDLEREYVIMGMAELMPNDLYRRLCFMNQG